MSFRVLPPSSPQHFDSSWLSTIWNVSEGNTIPEPSGARDQPRPSFQVPPALLLPLPQVLAASHDVLLYQSAAGNPPAGHQTRPILPPQHGVQLAMPPPANPHPAPRAIAGAARDAPKRRKPRSTAPSDEEWDRHKPIIEDLYMIRNLSLPQTIRTMRDEHRFTATEKMYKERFRAWKWSKYLPKGTAGWMMNKVKERQPRRTEFKYGNQTWTEERVKRTYDRMGADETKLDQNTLDGPTPEGITYGTPTPNPATPLVISQPPPRAPSPTLWTSSQPAAPEDGSADRLLRSARQNVSLQNLDKLVIEALRADFRGEYDVAERKFLDAIAGFEETLSATDQRTMRASYMLADSYANQQRMDRAAEVLNRLTNNIVERWGSQQYRTVVPFLTVVDLLQSWNHPEHAQNLIQRALGNWDENEGVRLLDIPLHNTRMVLGSPDDLATARAEIFGDMESSDAGAKFRLANLWMSANVGEVNEILSRLIAQCDRYPEKLTVQAIQTRCDLAEWYIYQGSRRKARSILKQAWRSLEKYLGEQDIVPRELLGLCCRVAFLYFRAGRPGICDTVLEHVAHFAERHVLIPTPQSSIDLVVGLHINIGLEYQQRSSWSRAGPWYERALALLLCLRWPDHVLVEKLTKALEERGYQPDSPDSPDGTASPYQVRFSAGDNAA